MDLAKLLEILKEVRAIIEALAAIGVKVNGNVNLADLLTLVKK